ncbi:hypothetical protein HK102_000812 [Quaeritorhiza haematococci]|nr:hypothetical protein HK102_000812 [Quaeritorhiza haematococci]
MLSLKQIAIAGAGAGAINSFVAGPIELLKIRLQAQYENPVAAGANANAKPQFAGPVDVARHLAKTYGWRRGIFRGTWATIAREVPVIIDGIVWSGFQE